ncbi:hypothetical protein R1CP_37175 (plasmid) [Rhodococcus opacus]|uniref:Transposase n=1 Tax=Rhodococcus opacus TaxID=37919 RepID=A0A1B1KHF3_RHOOP|nr:hypothetical protein [Rhodococcus opacus]ANS32041.1 hypothetical protein R1CP_37175 [Rhodococcus opacus]
MAASVTHLCTPSPRTLCSAAEAFLDTIGPTNTRRASTTAIVKTVDVLDSRAPDALPGPSRALDSVSDDEIGAALETHWGHAAVDTWNTRRVAARQMAELVRRTRVDRAEASLLDAARSRTAIDRLISRRDILLREKDTVADALRDLRSGRGTTPAQHRRPRSGGPVRPDEIQGRQTPHPRAGLRACRHRNVSGGSSRRGQ